MIKRVRTRWQHLLWVLGLPDKRYLKLTAKDPGEWHEHSTRMASRNMGEAVANLSKVEMADSGGRV